MKIMLIGGAGFVGRNIMWQQPNHDFVVVDNLQSYHMGVKPADVPDVEFLQKSCGEITNQDLKNVDVMVHLASKQDYTIDYGNYIDNNCTQVARLFELDLSNLSQFVVFSSQTTYGDTTVPYIVGQHRHPIEQYGISKLFQEELCRLLCPVPLKVIIPCVVIGKGQSGSNLYSGVVRNTIARVAAGLPPMIYSDGEQIRDFVDVEDVARYVLSVVDNPDQYPNSINATSSETPQRVIEVVRRIQEYMGDTTEPIIGRYTRANDKERCYSKCSINGLFGPAMTGKAIENHVDSLLSSTLPSADKILALDEENERNGVIKRRTHAQQEQGSNLTLQ